MRNRDLVVGSFCVGCYKICGFYKMIITSRVLTQTNTVTCERCSLHFHGAQKWTNRKKIETFRIDYLYRVCTVCSLFAHFTVICKIDRNIGARQPDRYSSESTVHFRCHHKLSAKYFHIFFFSFDLHFLFIHCDFLCVRFGVVCGRSCCLHFYFFTFFSRLFILIKHWTFVGKVYMMIFFLYAQRFGTSQKLPWNKINVIIYFQINYLYLSSDWNHHKKNQVIGNARIKYFVDNEVSWETNSMSQNSMKLNKFKLVREKFSDFANSLRESFCKTSIMHSILNWWD